MEGFSLGFFFFFLGGVLVGVFDVFFCFGGLFECFFGFGGLFWCFFLFWRDGLGKFWWVVRGLRRVISLHLCLCKAQNGLDKDMLL